MVFPFYQGLNPLLNGKSNKDTPLSSDRRRARAGPWGGVGPQLFKFWALYCMCVCLFASLLSRPPGAKINGKRSLLIQGRMQIFKKNLSFWCISSLGTYLERCAVNFWQNFHLELLILKTKTFPLCKNNEKLEFRPQCHILRFWRQRKRNVNVT